MNEKRNSELLKGNRTILWHLIQAECEQCIADVNDTYQRCIHWVSCLEGQAKIWAKQLGYIHRTEVKIDEGKVRRIINLAKDCPDKECNNQGYTVIQSRDREYITKEMASDGCCPEMEGSIHCDEEFEQVQCQWCWETPDSKFNLAKKIATADILEK